MTDCVHPHISDTRRSAVGRTVMFLPRMIGLWIEIRRQRSQLGRLEQSQLRDIGISPDEARHEVQRPFWDAPAHWLR